MASRLRGKKGNTVPNNKTNEPLVNQKNQTKVKEDFATENSKEAKKRAAAAGQKSSREGSSQVKHKPANLKGAEVKGKATSGKAAGGDASKRAKAGPESDSKKQPTLDERTKERPLTRSSTTRSGTSSQSAKSPAASMENESGGKQNTIPVNISKKSVIRITRNTDTQINDSLKTTKERKSKNDKKSDGGALTQGHTQSKLDTVMKKASSVTSTSADKGKSESSIEHNAKNNAKASGNRTTKKLGITPGALPPLPSKENAATKAATPTLSTISKKQNAVSTENSSVLNVAEDKGAKKKIENHSPITKPEGKGNTRPTPPIEDSCISIASISAKDIPLPQNPSPKILNVQNPSPPKIPNVQNPSPPKIPNVQNPSPKIPIVQNPFAKILNVPLPPKSEEKVEKVEKVEKEIVEKVEKKPDEIPPSEVKEESVEEFYKRHEIESFAALETELKGVSFPAKLGHVDEGFFPVLAKDFKRTLPWPKDMIVHTQLTPSLSYSVNPLSYDFKSVLGKGKLKSGESTLRNGEHKSDKGKKKKRKRKKKKKKSKSRHTHGSGYESDASESGKKHRKKKHRKRSHNESKDRGHKRSHDSSDDDYRSSHSKRKRSRYSDSEYSSDNDRRRRKSSYSDDDYHKSRSSKRRHRSSSYSSYSDREGRSSRRERGYRSDSYSDDDRGRSKRSRHSRSASRSPRRRRHSYSRSRSRSPNRGKGVVQEKMKQEIPKIKATDRAGSCGALKEWVRQALKESKASDPALQSDRPSTSVLSKTKEKISDLIQTLSSVEDKTHIPEGKGLIVKQSKTGKTQISGKPVPDSPPSQLRTDIKQETQKMQGICAFQASASGNESRAGGSEEGGDDAFKVPFVPGTMKEEDAPKEKSEDDGPVSIPPEEIEKYKQLEQQARLHVQQKLMQAQGQVGSQASQGSQQSVSMEQQQQLLGQEGALQQGETIVQQPTLVPQPALVPQQSLVPQPTLLPQQALVPRPSIVPQHIVVHRPAVRIPGVRIPGVPQIMPQALGLPRQVLIPRQGFPPGVRFVRTPIQQLQGHSALQLHEVQREAQMEAQREAQMEAQREAQMEAQMEAQREAQMEAQMEAQIHAIQEGTESLEDGEQPDRPPGFIGPIHPAHPLQDVSSEQDQQTDTDARPPSRPSSHHSAHHSLVSPHLAQSPHLFAADPNSNPQRTVLQMHMMRPNTPVPVGSPMGMQLVRVQTPPNSSGSPMQFVQVPNYGVVMQGGVPVQAGMPIQAGVAGMPGVRFVVPNSLQGVAGQVRALQPAGMQGALRIVTPEMLQARMPNASLASAFPVGRPAMSLAEAMHMQTLTSNAMQVSSPVGALQPRLVTSAGLRGIHPEGLQAFVPGPIPGTVIPVSAESGGALPAGAIPTGAIPAGAGSGVPSAALPQGVIPAGSLPPGMVHSAALPQGAISAGSLPPGMVHSRALPPGVIPAGSLPPGMVHSRALPPGVIPAGSLPPGMVHSRAFPAGAFPAGAIPMGTLPAGAMPAEALTAGAVSSAVFPRAGISAGAMAAGHPGLALPRMPGAVLPAGAVPASAFQGLVQRPAVPAGLRLAGISSPGPRMGVHPMGPRLVGFRPNLPSPSIPQRVSPHNPLGHRSSPSPALSISARSSPRAPSLLLRDNIPNPEQVTGSRSVSPANSVNLGNGRGSPINTKSPENTTVSENSGTQSPRPMVPISISIGGVPVSVEIPMPADGVICSSSPEPSHRSITPGSDAGSNMSMHRPPRPAMMRPPRFPGPGNRFPMRGIMDPMIRPPLPAMTPEMVLRHGMRSPRPGLNVHGQDVLEAGPQMRLPGMPPGMRLPGPRSMHEDIGVRLPPGAHQLPPGTVHLPPGAIPQGAVPPGAIRLPPDAVRSPLGAVPSGSASPGAVRPPPGAMFPGGIRMVRLPPGAIPQGAMPAGAMRVPPGMPAGAMGLPQGMPAGAMRLPQGMPAGAMRLPQGMPAGAMRLPQGMPAGAMRLPTGMPAGAIRLPPGMPPGAVQLPPGFQPGGPRMPLHAASLMGKPLIKPTHPRFP